MSQAVVLLSAGLDSTINLYAAKRQLDVVRVLTFDYGQRAAPQEIARSQKLCELLHLKHEVIELPWLGRISNSSLTNRDVSVPQGSSVKINDLSVSQKTAASVWVPNRNGVFLNIAASYAEALGAQYVVPGFNREEATTFADNSYEYTLSLNESFAYSTRSRVQVKCFTIDKDKTEIVKMGRELGVDFDLIWPCYFGASEICGQCESCLRFQRAISS
jgi:7-cyano-7-deazaguanine synthase